MGDVRWLGVVAMIAGSVSIGCSGAGGNGDLVGPEPAVREEETKTPGAASNAGAKEEKTEKTADETRPPTDPEAMFASQTGTTTPDVVLGLWGRFGYLEDGTKIENRLRLYEGEVTLARRCSKNGVRTPIAYGKASARVSDAEIAVLAAKSDVTTAEGVRCSVELAPDEYHPRCELTPAGWKPHCFTVDGKRLLLYGATKTDLYVFDKKSD